MKTFQSFIAEAQTKVQQPSMNVDPTPGKAGLQKLKKIVNKINNSDGASIND